MEILLSFCLRCLSRTASMTLRVSGSFLEPSLLRISAKNRKKWLLSSLALYFQMTLGCRPHLPSIDPSLSSVDCIFFFLPCPFSASCCISCPEISGSLVTIFLKNKKKQTNNKNARLCFCHGYLVIPSVFLFYLCYAEIPPLSTNQISEIPWLIL